MCREQRFLFGFIFMFRVFPSASRCLYRANALPVSVGVCGTVQEYLLSNDDMAFSFFGVFFPFPFLQPVANPRKLPAWTSTPSTTKGPWVMVAGGRLIYVDTCVLLLYPIRRNFMGDNSKGARLGNACGNPRETETPFCPTNTFPESGMGSAWQDLQYNALPQTKAGVGRPCDLGGLELDKEKSNPTEDAPPPL